MNTVVVSPVASAVAKAYSLSDTRNDLVKAAKKTGQVLGAYGSAMSQAFDLVDNQGQVTTKWYELKGKLKAGVNDERALFITAMTAEGFGKGTIDVYWQRVKEASGYVTAGNKVQGEPNIDEKTMADLKTIINRIFKAEEKSDSTCDKSSEVKGKLMDVFAELGGDIDNLG